MIHQNLVVHVNHPIYCNMIEGIKQQIIFLQQFFKSIETVEYSQYYYYINKNIQ